MKVHMSPEARQVGQKGDGGSDESNEGILVSDSVPNPRTPMTTSLRPLRLLLWFVRTPTSSSDLSRTGVLPTTPHLPWRLDFRSGCPITLSTSVGTPTLTLLCISKHHKGHENHEEVNSHRHSVTTSGTVTDSLPTWRTVPPRPEPWLWWTTEVVGPVRV